MWCQCPRGNGWVYTREGNGTGAGGMLAGVMECPAQGGAAEGSRCVSGNQHSQLRDPEGEGLFLNSKSRMYGPFL